MDKHFEPVTARSLVKDFYRNAIAIYHSGVNFDKGMGMLKDIIEPHIRKPSDDDKPLFNLEADIEWLVRGCMRIMHNKKDGDIKAYHELKEFVSQKVSTTGPETDSVPARCEEAYNEAKKLLRDIRHKYSPGWHNFKDFQNMIDVFLQKSNPFKEADIVKEDVDIYMDILEKERSQPKKYPFDLGLAAQGHKVVTRDDRGAKVVCDNLRGTDKPIAAVVTNTDGSKHGFTYSESGRHTAIIEHPLDLFILKEPETIEIRVMKHKVTGQVDVLAPDEEFMNKEQWELIKTIKTTI